jgi:DNA replication protein DnaC
MRWRQPRAHSRPHLGAAVVKLVGALLPIKAIWFVDWHREPHDDSINKAISKLIRSDLILVDVVGLLPVSADAADALFRVVDAAYEKRSIAISSNIHPSGFDELMPKTLATATVDRLLHPAHVIITDRQDSYRLAQATAEKESRP